MKSKSRIILSSLIGLMIVVMCCSCGSFVKNSYNSLNTAAITADTSMKIVSDLYKNGQLNDNDLKNIEPVYTKFRFSYLASVSALEAYKRAETSENEDKLIVSLVILDNVMNEFMVLIQEYAITKTKVE